jgi:hypothetical protein
MVWFGIPRTFIFIFIISFSLLFTPGRDGGKRGKIRYLFFFWFGVLHSLNGSCLWGMAVSLQSSFIDIYVIVRLDRAR